MAKAEIELLPSKLIIGLETDALSDGFQCGRDTKGQRQANVQKNLYYSLDVDIIFVIIM